MVFHRFLKGEHGLFTHEGVAMRRDLRAQVQEIKALVQAANPRTRQKDD
jgi:hypothetical protein